MFRASIFLVTMALVASDKVIINDRLSLFDNKYITYSRDHSYDSLFGFDRYKLCTITRNSISGWTVSIQQINSIEKTGTVKLILSHDGVLKPKACFCYNDHSYLIFQNINSNETLIIRGNQEKVVKNFPVGDLRYDHFNSRLYLLSDHKIDEINLRSIENLWINNGTEINRKSIGSMPSSYTDFMIIEEQIYLIKENKIYRYKINSNDILPIYVTDANSSSFTFIIFRAFEKIRNSNSNPWLYFLSILDLILVVICILVLRILKIKNQDKSFDIFDEERVYKELQRR